MRARIIAQATGPARNGFVAAAFQAGRIWLPMQFLHKNIRLPAMKYVGMRDSREYPHSGSRNRASVEGKGARLKSGRYEGKDEPRKQEAPEANMC